MTLLLTSLTYSETTIRDSRAKRRVIEKLNPRLIKGRSIVQMNVFEGQTYYAYVAKNVNTIIKLPYTLNKNVAKPEDQIVNIKAEIGDDYFHMFPISSAKINDKVKVHVFCENGFDFNLNIIVVDEKQANQEIKFLDGKTAIMGAEFQLKKNIKTLKQTIKKQNQFVSDIFFNARHDTLWLGDRKKYGGRADIRWDTLTIFDGLLVVALSSENLDMLRLPIVLEIEPFEGNVFAEKRQPIVVLKPDHQMVVDERRRVVSFQVAGYYTQFRLILRIGTDIQFNKKINLNKEKRRNSLFEEVY